MTICLLDTSVFVEFLQVPFMSSNSREIIGQMRAKVDAEEEMFLPMATILETGNHIGQNGNGNQRRACAERFVQQVSRAIDGNSPFTPIDFLPAEDIRDWLSRFPDFATQGMGLGDVSISFDWDRLSKRFQGRRVYIWALDGHLQGYDTDPPAD